MTRIHFITGTTLTLLLAVAVLGNAPSATADAADTAHDVSESERANDAVLLCDLNEPSDDDASTPLDMNVPTGEARSPKPEARGPKPSLDFEAEPDADVAPTQRDEETLELARRVSAALLGQTKPTRMRVARAAEATNDEANADRVWRCGGWEELWQGRGSARSCEWK